MTNTSKTNQWQLSNYKDLYTIKLTDGEGSESITATVEQMQELIIFLNTLPIPLPENELPL